MANYYTQRRKISSQNKDNSTIFEATMIDNAVNSQPILYFFTSPLRNSCNWSFPIWPLSPTRDCANSIICCDNALISVDFDEEAPRDDV
jgi:hypothetical protein